MQKLILGFKLSSACLHFVIIKRRRGKTKSSTSLFGWSGTIPKISFHSFSPSDYFKWIKQLFRGQMFPCQLLLSIFFLFSSIFFKTSYRWRGEWSVPWSNMSPVLCWFATHSCMCPGSLLSWGCIGNTVSLSWQRHKRNVSPSDISNGLSSKRRS